MQKVAHLKQHLLFATWVEKRAKLFTEMLQEGERIIGEWLAQAHGLFYQITDEPIIFFDYFNALNDRIVNESLSKKVGFYGLTLPRKLHQSDPVTVEELLPKLNEKTPTIKSVELPEEMVFRVERKGRVDFLAKWVRKDFPAGKFCIGIEEENLIWNVSLNYFD